MKINKIYPFTMLALFGLLMGSITGCTKEGFGGDATLTGIVAHHEVPIPNATVYIKFNAEELPGTLETDFDASTVADADGRYTFDELKKGDYYLYGVGFDSAFSEIVLGGIYAEVVGGRSNEYDVAVTE